jgi:hypothetical protein
MSQRTSSPALALRNRSEKRAFGSPVTNEVVDQGHEIWPGMPQYLDPHPQNVNHNVLYGQYAWVDHLDDSTLRPSAGVDKIGLGYMFQGHPDSQERMSAPDYASWYYDNNRLHIHETGDVQNFVPGTFPPSTGSWYTATPEYTGGPMSSSYQSNDMILQTSNDYPSLPVEGSGADFQPPELSSVNPQASRSSFSNLSSGWSEEPLQSRFTDAENDSMSAEIDPLMSSVGSEFDFPGVGSFSMTPGHNLKAETDVGVRPSVTTRRPNSTSQPSQGFTGEMQHKKPKSAARKRQAASPAPGTEVVLAKGNATFNECVTVFETVPGAISQTKRRRKLSPSSHESFKVTRKIGACLECRFRKRPVCIYVIIREEQSANSRTVCSWNPLPILC